MRRFILNDEQLSRAQDRAGELIREFGMYAYATDTDKTLRSMLSQCAGSRVGNTCNKISVSWPGCDIAVGNVLAMILTACHPWVVCVWAHWG